MSNGQGLFGIVLLPLFAWALSECRRAVPWRTVVTALLLQATLALLLLHLTVMQTVFLAVNQAVAALQTATRAGTQFVFGYLGGGTAPFAAVEPAAGFVFAFQALPVVLLISAISRVLFHWRVLPAIVRGFAWLLGRTLGIGGAVGVSTAANVFVGMVEAPLLVRPYLKDLSRGELFMVMTGGMATIAGSVFVLYATLLAPVLADAAGHLLAASLINAPGAILMAALLVPPGDTRTAGGEVWADDEAESTMGALARGTADGVALLINIAAMLIVLVACVSLVNQLLALLPTGGQPISLQRLLGWPMAPVAWLIGVPWSEAATAGSLLATKTVLNELIAYADLAALPADALSPRSRLILVYALCGFANFGSLGIMIGGLGTMLPERRAEIAGLGLRAILSGTLATCLSGAIVGVVA